MRHEKVMSMPTCAADDTLPRLLVHNAAQHGNKIAMREKDRGIWKEMTWSEYFNEVLVCAAGLDALGVRPGNAVMILGDNRARLYAGVIASSMLGAYAMPAYPGTTLDELRHFVGEVKVVAALAEDQEQVDKFLDLREAGSTIEYIVYEDKRGLNTYDASGLLSWEELNDKGETNLKADPQLRDRIVNRAAPDDPAIFLHSSGTTGKPKGVVLSHRNVIAAVRNAYSGGAFNYGEEVLAYLPMAWVGDFALTVAAGIAFRFTVNVPERQETVLRDMREIAPSLYLAAPRSWDNLLTSIQVGIENSTPLKKWLYHFFTDRAIASERRKLDGQEGSHLEWLGRLLGERIVFGPIKDLYGLSRLKSAFTGGEAIGEDTFVFYRALGIKLRQLYGQTENAAFNAIQMPDEVKLHTVGRPLPGVQVKVTDGGEILLKAESVFRGYYNNPLATAETLKDGWLHTGDAGYLEDDGHLVVLGRVSEVVHTKEGERYVPNYIENRLKFSPYIKDAAVFGAGRDELTAIVCIDLEAAGHWAETNAVPYVSYADLSQRNEIAGLLGDAFHRVNKALPESLKLHRFVSLHKEFDPDDGEITRTRKLRRSVVEERYASVIDALYDGSKEIHVKAAVTYESGEVGLVERTLVIREV
ncbi:MAG: AMP-binding protein [Bradyrhizobium sp.]|jgi:long-chain acyl-CoA synthetase|uniref:AMP-dependent synthetase/ligase n=1 Tax=Bradyrhizobium TaxID=374 RepID=UPI00046292DA|nr:MULTISPECIES: AMP-binding protein [Bradyrhizobium]MBJ7402089.1 AMP-binding protein [Bradyrhizobium sp.]